MQIHMWRYCILNANILSVYILYPIYMTYGQNTVNNNSYINSNGRRTWNHSPCDCLPGKYVKRIKKRFIYKNMRMEWAHGCQNELTSTQVTGAHRVAFPWRSFRSPACMCPAGALGPWRPPSHPPRRGSTAGAPRCWRWSLDDIREERVTGFKTETKRGGR